MVGYQALGWGLSGLLAPAWLCSNILGVACTPAVAAALRGLVRIKVEDDQDIATARRAVAECGYFPLALAAEAELRGLSEAELLAVVESSETHFVRCAEPNMHKSAASYLALCCLVITPTRCASTWVAQRSQAMFPSYPPWPC